MDNLTKRRIKIALVVWAVLFLAGLGLWLGRPAYRNWQQERFLKQARDYCAVTSYTNASLCARKVLTINPSNVGACRVMAQITEAIRSPEVINWLQRLTELEPGVLQNQLDLAKAAIVQRDLARLEKALSGVKPADRTNAVFHELAAILAAGVNQVGLSEAHLAEAAKLDPENKRLQINLAVLHIQARDEALAAGARKRLEQLSTDEKYRLDALRILTAAALRSNDLAGARSHSSRLVADPLATFHDRVLHLSVLSQSKDQGFADSLAALQKEAEKKPEQIQSLAAWMMGNQMADAVLLWLGRLPAGLKQEWTVVMATVDAHLERKDWTSLTALLEERKWDENEYLRLGLLARVAFERRENLIQQKHWREALKEAGDRVPALAALTRMADAWKWTAQKDELLWLILNRFPNERWTLKELLRMYTENGTTRDLLKVYAAVMEYDSKNLVAKNDFANIALLLRVELPRAHELALEAYNQRPQDPIAASTYAYSLHVQGKTAAALKVLEKLKPEQLANPNIAAYYGVFLSTTGETNRARKYLDLGLQARLLPEEKAMLGEARKGL